ncbi:MAG: hypothetical protein QM751_07800 [Paludibacteraceae bacterium]
MKKHDFFDENVITGEVGPQAYWEVGSATTSAGSNVSFITQYYSTEADIDHSEVWYNITERIYKKVSCPWVTTFTYSVTSETTAEKRISQKIQEYSHSLAVWSDSLHAYTFKSSFPIRSTLSSFSWDKVTEFDSTKMNTYFGPTYMQHFKDSLYTLMKYADFKKMILGLNLLNDFKQYTDSTQDFNAGVDVFVYHFPKNTNGDTPVPAGVKTIYDAIPFDKLIEGTSNYELEYKRTYSVDAIMRVYDTKGVYGTTTSKTININ